jgi:hypothetical protein
LNEKNTWFKIQGLENVVLCFMIFERKMFWYFERGFDLIFF